MIHLHHTTLVIMLQSVSLFNLFFSCVLLISLSLSVSLCVSVSPSLPLHPSCFLCSLPICLSLSLSLSHSFSLFHSSLSVSLSQKLMSISLHILSHLSNSYSTDASATVFWFL